MSHAIIACAVACALLTGCRGGSRVEPDAGVEQLLRASHEAGRRQLDRLAAIYRSLPELAPLEDDGLYFPGGGDGPGEGAIAVGYSDYRGLTPDGCNTRIFLAQQLADLSTHLDLRLEPDDAEWLSDVWALLNGDPDPSDLAVSGAGEVRDLLAELEKLEYVLVVRPEGVRMPEVHGTDAFIPGYVEGDVRLFALETQAELGGFGIVATNVPDIVTDNPLGQSTFLEIDLANQLRAVVDNGLADLGSAVRVVR